MIEVFNRDKLLKIPKDIPIDKIKLLLEREFVLENRINIVFVTPKYIQRLNSEYRKKDEVTDLLSFNIDSDTILGEIYICPEYVINTTPSKNLQKQITRLFIHGILHLKGYDHEEKFDELDYSNEAMYIKQEQILNKILIEILQ
ncbi:MAG: rRNA maturation RNase YbeY [Candidatus Dojkabacteria bacterium]|jgi:probable rRNA maturation factor|nr:rRNA maturation RNase YbeY [Candidatus Dojkabacteria bacterium]MDD2270105.1 rRNA maturation RNase YbeY [Candidatus Dojkabacteria bacterium]